MKSLLSILLTCISFSVFAQYKIYFQDENAQPLTDITAFCIENSISYSSDKNGIIHININEPQILSFSIFKENYKSLQKSIDFRAKNITIIILQPLSQEINEVTIEDEANSIEKLQLRAIEDMMIFESKKSEKIVIEKINANLSTNNSRQIYAKVSGLNIWESSGAGLSTEIGGRGLSPERSSNFNIRQNGYDISADALGYPDAYYVPPAEMLEKIEVVRGAAALQYGTQFGGMVNYQLKTPAEKTTLAIESRQTVGSFGFFDTYNQLSGTKEKTSYLAAFQYKRGNGWRENSGFDAYFGYVNINHQASEKLSYGIQYTYYTYKAQQAGGLTDVLFEDDAQQSIRERNWFQVKWHLPEVHVSYKFNNRIKVESKTFALIAQRNAVGFLGNITRTDPLDERELLVDKYQNIGNESKLLIKYNIKNQLQALVIGTRLYSGHTTKKQGNANDGYEASFTYLNPEKLEGSDYDFPSRNIAVFAENIFRPHPKFTITPGIRFENINTKADGYYRETSTDLAGNILIDTTFNDIKKSNRYLFISGLGLSFKPKENQEIYASFSQNYRAVNFNDLRISNPNIRVDENLEDEKGFNADIGARGVIKDILAYDVSFFYLQYANRIGFALKSDSVLFNTYRFRTNISASRTFGLESVVEIDWLRLSKKINKDFSLKLFTNFSWIDGKYIKSDEVAFQDKKVELVPSILSKTGLSFQWKNLQIGGQYSYTGEQFTDATNTEFTSDAVNGIIPSYYTVDMSAKYSYKWFSLEANINNLTDNRYFTRRAVGYPGPGIIPSDGRSLFLTLGFGWEK
ncbi:MAG: TonB-dependent receptor family protein [Chitinophagales bacterium]